MPFEAGEGRAVLVHRLHPISLLFGLIDGLKRIIVPAGFLFFFAAGERTIALAIIPFMLLTAVIGPLVRYFTFGYRFGGEDLLIRSGLLFRNERVLPYTRIQNVDLVQGPLHRLLKVAIVRLETASGSDAEAEIRVLSIDAVERIRERVARGRAASGALPAGAEAPAAPPSETLVRMNAGDVVTLGIVSNRGMVVVAALFGLISQFGFDDEIYKRLPDAAGVVRSTSESPVDAPLWLVAATLVMAVLAAIVVLRMLSIALAFLRFHGFTLERAGEDLRSRFGLFTRVSQTIPRRRVQRVIVTATPLARLFGRASVQADTAGRSGGESNDGEQRPERSQLAPLVTREAVAPLVATVLPGADLETVDWQPLAPGARRRVFRRGLLLVGAAIAVLSIGAHPLWLVASVPGALWAWWRAVLTVRHTAYGLDDAHLYHRYGWWTRHVAVVPLGKVQTAKVRTTPFDRRARMAAVLVDTAGAGAFGRAATITLLESARAWAIAARLYDVSARTVFRW